MLEFLLILLSTLVEALRRLWQKVTGRVPVPVRVRRFQSAPFSHTVLNRPFANAHHGHPRW